MGMRLTSIALTLTVALAATTLAQPPSPPSSVSAAAARALAGLLQSQDRQVIAAKDPDAPGRFIAAMYIPGTELLVVSAVYPAPALFEERLKSGDDREIYIDLQSAASLKDRFFVEDLQANGLESQATTGQPFDTILDNGVETRFNSDWAGQKLTEAEYRARLAAADARYAKMLSVLIGRLRPIT